MGLEATQPVKGVSNKCDLSQSRKLQRLATKNGNLACSKFRYDTFQKVNNKDADQTVRRSRLVCAFVVSKHRRHVFLCRGPYILSRPLDKSG